MHLLEDENNQTILEDFFRRRRSAIVAISSQGIHCSVIVVFEAYEDENYELETKAVEVLRPLETS